MGSFAKNMKLSSVAFLATVITCFANESVIRVSPGSPKEAFLIGATAKKIGDSIAFEISIAPRTTKPTWQFDCLVTTAAGSVGWRIDTPCIDQKKKKTGKEIIKIVIPEAQIDTAVFECRHHLPSINTTEIWRIQLQDYKNGAYPE